MSAEKERGRGDDLARSKEPEGTSTPDGAEAVPMRLGVQLRQRDENGSTVRSVRTAFQCRETSGGETARWAWLFLDDGRLVEIGPISRRLYATHRILSPGEELYEELVAPDGVLARFERRARARLVHRRPVFMTIGGREYRVASTGTVSVDRQGPEPDCPVWRFWDSNPRNNVYFMLFDPLDPSAVILGLWTTGVCLFPGRVLAEGDLTIVGQ